MQDNEGRAVLILVLVEHTLGVGKAFGLSSQCSVLILVLVEHTLGVQDNENGCARFSVLILVLVEHTLGAFEVGWRDKFITS